ATIYRRHQWPVDPQQHSRSRLSETMERRNPRLGIQQVNSREKECGRLDRACFGETSQGGDFDKLVPQPLEAVSPTVTDPPIGTDSMRVRNMIYDLHRIPSKLFHIITHLPRLGENPSQSSQLSDSPRLMPVNHRSPSLVLHRLQHVSLKSHA